MANKRFEAVATTSELVLTKEKSALRVELQYGKDGEPTELVIAEMYWKDSAWNYTRSQVRLNCTVDNAKYLLEGVKAMFESSKKVVKAAAKSSKIEDAIDSMTEDEKHALLTLLLGKSKETTAAKPKETKSSDSELILEHFIAARPTTKKR